MKAIRLGATIPHEIVKHLGPAHQLVIDGDVLITGGALARDLCSKSPGDDVDLLTDGTGYSKLCALLTAANYTMIAPGKNRTSNGTVERHDGDDDGSWDPVDIRAKWEPPLLLSDSCGWLPLDVMVLHPRDTLVRDAEHFLSTFDAAIAQQLLYLDTDGTGDITRVVSVACMKAHGENVPGWIDGNDKFTTDERRAKWDELLPGRLTGGDE